ncbi:MAG: rhomboid family intramembrane serine protease [Verrucomicrobiota bacterium]
MLFPYKIDTLFKYWPIANWVIMALTIAMFFASQTFSEETFDGLVLGGTSILGLVGHLVLHGDFLHLFGNMLFLWVFGNAVCAMMGSVAYALLYVIFGVLAAAAHVAFDADQALGASGAINGVVGMAFAMYPRNAVSVFWFFIFRFGTFEIPLWVLALLWCALDAYGALTGEAGIAYWAHLGGFIGGAIAGIVALKRGWLTLTHLDDPSLADLFKGKAKPKKKPTKGWAWEEPMSLKDE